MRLQLIAWRAWCDKVRSYLAQLVTAGAGAAVVLVLITPRAANADGGDIAYIANDRASIHILQSDGSGDQQLLTASDLSGLAWAPDGRLLAYTTLGSTGPQAQHIFVYDMATRGTTEVKTSVGTIGGVVFLPDGKHLATTTGQSGTVHCSGQLVTVDLGNGSITPVADIGGCLRGLQLAPDGSLVASVGTGAPAAYVVNVALPSGSVTQLTTPSDDLPFSGSGVVAPDDQTLAYVAHRGFDNSSPTDLVLSDRNGSNPRSILQGPFSTIDFAPDGSELAAARATDSASLSPNVNSTIWLIGVDGSNPHQVATGQDPMWRPTRGGGGTAPPLAPPTQQAQGAAVQTTGSPTNPAAIQQAPARVVESHSPLCTPRCFTFVWLIHGDREWDLVLPKSPRLISATCSKGPNWMGHSSCRSLPRRAWCCSMMDRRMFTCT